jgi:uncharacterized membrane protein YqjE
MDDSSPEGAVEGAKTGGASRGGLFRSLRDLLATVVATARTRLELLQAEIEEEKLRLAGIGLLAIAAVFFMALAVVVFTFFVMLLFWDTHRLLATGLVALLYLFVGLCCAAAARRRATTKSRLFAASLAQLDADRQRLTSAD